jgi:fatty acid desaturase
MVRGVRARIDVAVVPSDAGFGMIRPDHINAAFEGLGAVFTWRNALQLHRDRQVRGVYWPITAFFAAWGVWNLYFYPAIGQWWSFGAGAFLVIGNLAWVALAVKWRRA